MRTNMAATIEVTKFSQDGGIDINAKPNPNSWPIRQLLIQLQAKRWLHTVGRKEVAELRGSLKPHSSGCIVTTGYFSQSAITESNDQGKVPIELVDGYELASIAIKNSMQV
jgi:restriction endonuclease Mrr